MSISKVLEILKEHGYSIEDAIHLLEEMEWGWSANCSYVDLKEWITNNPL